MFGEHLGACLRASWYKSKGYKRTNPEKPHLALARDINELLVSRLVSAMDVGGLEQQDARKTWAIPTIDNFMHASLDHIYMDIDGLVGVFVHSGSGYGFQSEVFGSKTKAGQIKQDHLVECWGAMLFYPEKLSRIDVIYIDRGTLETICHSVTNCPVDKKVFIQNLIELSGNDLPAPSYKKQWSSKEEVAKLYAEKKISKARYETWIDTRIGGDWHCEYCPFLDQCISDKGGSK